ncbi:hypothetical protein Tco_1358306, partial [Tanacetum coccineum]
TLEEELSSVLSRVAEEEKERNLHLELVVQGLRASRKLKPGALSLNNMVYYSATPRDGIFEIDLSNSYANESSIYTVSNKSRFDLNLRRENTVTAEPV